MTTADRASLLAKHCQDQDYEPYLGYFAAVDLIHWLKVELGHPEVLDQFVELHQGSQTKARASSNILHILSGNTPHAALQSLVRGLLIGSVNTVKLPSGGLPIVEQWIATLPEALARLVNTITVVSDEIFERATTVIAIGSDETMLAIQKKIQPQQRFIPHGHKLSIGLIDRPSEHAARLAVQDICAHNQQGCLSLHTLYIKEDPAAMLPLIATAMREYEAQSPRGTISLSESGAISNLRETIRYHAANEPEDFGIEHSLGDTSWTAIFRNSPTLIPSPLNRVVSIQPWPDNFADLGSEVDYLSSIAIHPKNELIGAISALNIPRICELGDAQHPPLHWHHDGIAPLASLVHWQDIH